MYTITRVKPRHRQQELKQKCDSEMSGNTYNARPRFQRSEWHWHRYGKLPRCCPVISTITRFSPRTDFARYKKTFDDIIDCFLGHFLAPLHYSAFVFIVFIVLELNSGDYAEDLLFLLGDISKAFKGVEARRVPHCTFMAARSSSVPPPHDSTIQGRVSVAL